MDEVTLSVAEPGDASHARERVRQMGHGIGFQPRAVEELVLVVSELSSNLVRHGGGGELVLSPHLDQSGPGITIEARDGGPGIKNIDEAMADGFSTGGSLGYGLGTVNRLMDEVEVISPAANNRGTVVTCCRRVPCQDVRPGPLPLEVGVAARPYPGEKVSGDAYFVKSWGTRLLVAVMDGLGHGKHAHQAGAKAREYVERHFESPLEALFQGTSHNCRGTRGVVMAVVRIDWARKEMEHASIGNVETRLFGVSDPPGMISRRGILGGKYPALRTTSRPWQSGMVLVLHTDGVTSFKETEEDLCQRELMQCSLPAQEVAWQLLRRRGKNSDDATVVVVKDAQ